MGLPPGGVPPGGNGGDNPLNNPGLPQAQTPANPSVSMDAAEYARVNDLVASLSDRMASVATSVSDMTKSLTAALQPLGKLNTEAEALHDSVKDTVNQYDDVRDKLRTLVDFQRRSATFQTQNVTSFRQLNKEVEKLREDAEALAKKGFMSPEAHRGYQRLMTSTSKVTETFRGEMNKLGKSMDDALDTATIKRMSGEFKNLERDVINAINNTRKLGTIRQAISKAGLTEHDIPLVGRYIGARRSQVERFGSAAQDIKDARAAKRAGQTDMYEAAKASFTPERLAALGLRRTDSGKIAGTVRSKWGAGGGDHQRMAGEIATAAGGGGWLDRKIGANALASGGEGMLAGIVARGGGSFTKGFGGMVSELGVGGTLGHLGEGGIGAAGSLIGKMAIPLAALDAIKDFFDSTVERNKKYEAALAGGGAFSSTGGSFGPLSKSLSPTLLGSVLSKGAFSGERNLRIAQAMVQGGFSIADLAGGAQAKTGEFAPGVMGQFQRNVYGAGRVAGLGDEETVKTTIRLLQQYRQSMSSSEGFFITVDKSAKAAGISTVKYISILDGITEGFGRLNKSFNESMNLLKLLGESGQNTADDMKDFADSLGGKNQQLSTPIGALLLSQTTPQRRAQMAAEQGNATTARVEQVAQAAEKAGKPIDRKMLEGFTNIADLQEYMEENVYKGLTPEQKALVAPAAKELAQAIQLRQAYRGFAGQVPGQAATRPLAFQEQIEQLTGPGGNELFKTQMSSQTYQFMAKRLGLPNLVETMARGQLTGDQTTRLNETLKALGIQNPQDAQARMQGTVQAIAPGTLAAITNRTLNPQQVGLMWRLLSKNPQIKADLAKYGAPTDVAGQADVLKKFADESEKNRHDIRESILKNMDVTGEGQDNILEGLMSTTEALPTDKEKQDTMSTAEKMAADTRTTSDYLADIRDAILNNLVPAVDSIADFLLHPLNTWDKMSTKMFGTDWNKAANQLGAGAPGAGVYAWEKGILSGKTEQERASRLSTALTAFGAVQDQGNPNQFTLPDTMVPSLRNAVLGMLKDPSLTALPTGAGGALATVDQNGKIVINNTYNNVDASNKGMPNNVLPPATNTPLETQTPRALNPKPNTGAN